jgi:translin
MVVGGGPFPSRREELLDLLGPVRTGLEAANRAREAGLAACRRVIRASSSAIRAVHRLSAAEASAYAAEAESALREVQAALAPYPSLVWAGFLHDAEKEYVEARVTVALVDRQPMPGPGDLGVDPAAWMRGLAEAASELRRHLLDRLRAGELERGEELLAVMDDVYDALVVVDFPDALTGGLRRSLDSLRAVLERTRGDVTTTVLQTRLREAMERNGT